MLLRIPCEKSGELLTLALKSGNLHASSSTVIFVPVREFRVH